MRSPLSNRMLQICSGVQALIFTVAAIVTVMSCCVHTECRHRMLARLEEGSHNAHAEHSFCYPRPPKVEFWALSGKYWFPG